MLGGKISMNIIFQLLMMYQALINVTTAGIDYSEFITIHRIRAGLRFSADGKRIFVVITALIQLSNS